MSPWASSFLNMVFLMGGTVQRGGWVVLFYLPFRI